MVKLKESRATTKVLGIEKCPTGIRGLDEITVGGLPRGRPTLICGGAGSGKTLLAMEFIVRGMAHSNQVREFLLSDQGIQLKDVYTGPGTVLTGAARLVQETKDRIQAETERQSITRRRRELEQEQARARAELKALQLKTASLNDELQTLEEEEAHLTTVARERMELARVRGVVPEKDITKKGSNTHANRGR